MDPQENEEKKQRSEIFWKDASKKCNFQMRFLWDFACFRVFSKGKNSAPRAPPSLGLAPFENASTKLSNGARLVVGGARGAPC